MDDGTFIRVVTTDKTHHFFQTANAVWHLPGCFKALTRTAGPGQWIAIPWHRIHSITVESSHRED